MMGLAVTALSDGPAKAMGYEYSMNDSRIVVIVVTAANSISVTVGLATQFSRSPLPG